MAIVLGIILIALGGKIILRPFYYSPIYGTFFDFRGYNVELGIAVIAIGIGFIVTSLKKRPD